MTRDEIDLIQRNEERRMARARWRVRVSIFLGLATWGALLAWAVLGPRLAPTLQLAFGVLLATEAAAMALLLSIYSYRIQVSEAQQHVGELEEQAGKLRELSARDSLTKLYNHGYLMTRLDREISRARRHGRVLSIVVIDLNEFKRVNDTLGHLAGDEALKAVAAAIGARVRQEDIPARYGGDEFCLILPETDSAGARTLVDGLDAAVREMEALPGWNLSFVYGVATYPADGSDERSLFAAADARLYEDKKRRQHAKAS